MKFLQEKSFHRFPAGRWQWCVEAGLTPASRSCNIISYWFLVDLPWSSHHSVMCSTRLLNEINSPPAKQKSNRTLWELSAITEWVWGAFCRLGLGFSVSWLLMTHTSRCRLLYLRLTKDAYTVSVFCMYFTKCNHCCSQPTLKNSAVHVSSELCLYFVSYALVIVVGLLLQTLVRLELLQGKIWILQKVYSFPNPDML